MISESLTVKSEPNTCCRTQSLLRRNTEMPLPMSDRQLETVPPTQSLTAFANIKNGSADGDDNTFCDHEEISSELEIACDEFRDNALNIFYDIKEYTESRGARVLNQCDFDTFLTFCEEILDIPKLKKQSNQSITRGKDNSTIEDLDVLDPSY